MVFLAPYMYTKHMAATKFYFPWGATMLKMSDLAPRPYLETSLGKQSCINYTKSGTNDYLIRLFGMYHLNTDDEVKDSIASSWKMEMYVLAYVRLP